MNGTIIMKILDLLNENFSDEIISRYNDTYDYDPHKHEGVYVQFKPIYDDSGEVNNKLIGIYFTSNYTLSWDDLPYESHAIHQMHSFSFEGKTLLNVQPFSTFIALIDVALEKKHNVHIIINKNDMSLYSDFFRLIINYVTKVSNDDRINYEIVNKPKLAKKTAISNVTPQISTRMSDAGKISQKRADIFRANIHLQELRKNKLNQAKAVVVDKHINDIIADNYGDDAATIDELTDYLK